MAELDPLQDSHKPCLGWTRPIPRLSKRQEARRKERAPISALRREKAYKKHYRSERINKIDQLLRTDGLTVRLIIEIMWSLYQVDASKDFYKKRSSSLRRQINHCHENQSQRGRGAQRPNAVSPEPVMQIKDTIMLTNSPYEFDMHMHMKTAVPKPLTLTRYMRQERVLKTVDNFIYAVFDKGGLGWSASLTRFVAKNDTSCIDTYTWRGLSDQFCTMSQLVRSGLHAKAELALDRLLAEISAVCLNRNKDASLYQHPAFMTEFWRLCLRTLGIDSHIPKAKAMHRLLSSIRDSQEQDSPVHLLCSTLIDISQDRENGDDLRYTIRIGFVKAMLTMCKLIGDENTMVLDVLTYYCKYYNAAHLSRDLLKQKLELVKAETERLCLGGRATLAARYASASADYYILDQPLAAITEAEKLRNDLDAWVAEQGSQSWGLELEAFSSASTILASVYRKQARLSKSQEEKNSARGRCAKVLQRAVHKLDSGGISQRTRAALHCRMLKQWLMEWERKDLAKVAAAVEKRIEDGIPGKTCRRCVRARYCGECAAKFEANGSEPESQCLLCAPRKRNKLCQKCATRGSKYPVGKLLEKAWLELPQSLENPQNEDGATDMMMVEWNHQSEFGHDSTVSVFGQQFPG